MSFIKCDGCFDPALSDEERLKNIEEVFRKAEANEGILSDMMNQLLGEEWCILEEKLGIPPTE